MQISRRNLLSLAPTLLTGAALAVHASPARADDLAAQMSERALGSATAPVACNEWFSLTCPHCARFAKDVLPQIQTQLIDAGKVRYVFKDFPLDQVALTASMVARSLPPDRYAPFTAALLASQDRWAFARGVNSTEELAKMAALAGLGRPAFDAAIKNTALRDAILAEQDIGSKTFQVDSTPTFIFKGPGDKTDRASGELSFEDFSKRVATLASA